MLGAFRGQIQLDRGVLLRIQSVTNPYIRSLATVLHRSGYQTFDQRRLRDEGQNTRALELNRRRVCD